MSKTENSGKKKNLLQRTADKLGRKKKKKSKTGKSAAKEKSDSNDIESGRSTEIDFTCENEPETLVSSKKLHNKPVIKKDGQSKKISTEADSNRKSKYASIPVTTVSTITKTLSPTSAPASTTTTSNNRAKFSLDTLRWEGKLGDPVAEDKRIEDYKEKRRRRYEEAAYKLGVLSVNSINPAQEVQKVNLPGLTISQQADSKLNRSVQSVNLPSLVNHTPISSY
ncbi:unnamed protein product [Dimorphilus gyrociliatus]|uniref:Uncharacterized protein n=1 Tax=Dimorphilus gyrociliatus TaxID=2664684 RepID=A0A7I8VN43_9ANNE|nr:unnamed protein product [Dimorphilus gyrociliatus]